MEEVTLLFRHLPAELSTEEREDLLYCLGASQVKVMGTSGPMKNTAFAVFGSKDQATQVLNQLHQVELLGSRLVVEFAKKKLPSGADLVGGTKGQIRIFICEKLTSQRDISSLLTNSNITTKILFVSLLRTSKEAGVANDGAVSVGREDSLQPKTEQRELKFDTTFHTWGLKYPRRPELRYAYPPPTPSILTNILNALAAVPKFYVQVLHLMNKMDLPAPFGAVTPAPPINLDPGELTLPDDIDQQEMEISSETESELESGSEEEQGTRKIKELHRKKRLLRMMRKRTAKKPRLSDLQDGGDSVAPSTAAVPVSHVFEMVTDSLAGSKKIELKLPSSMKPATGPTSVHQLDHRSVPPHVPQLYHVPDAEHFNKTSLMQHQLQTSSIAQTHSPVALSPSVYQTHLPPMPSSHQDYQPAAPSLTATEVDPTLTSEESETKDSEVPSTGGFGIMQPVPKEQKDEVEEESAEREWSRSKFVSSTELRRSRLSHSEMKEMSVYKNYSEGEPSCRLYIKNLAKNVTEEDIHWVYGRYVDWEKEQETNIFDIKLMKDGRMKGQAFVTLPTEKSAVSALKDTNGFLLKDKPMVVQFARSAKVKQ